MPARGRGDDTLGKNEELNCLDCTRGITFEYIQEIIRRIALVEGVLVDEFSEIHPQKRAAKAALDRRDTR